MRQVIDETLRCAVIAPWAARFQDFDSELGFTTGTQINITV
jgi:cytochrome P450 family 20 subfamily A